jgi:hypothetical protein
MRTVSNQEMGQLFGCGFATRCASSAANHGHGRMARLASCVAALLCSKVNRRQLRLEGEDDV